MGLDGVLHEGAPPPERWLQQVWRHQRLRRDALRLGDGTPVRILHPGFWNREAGPDFRQAVVQIGTHAPAVGDVELDLVTGGWRGHGHHSSPRFSNVILHVVWDEADMDRARPPVMALKPYLDASLEELSAWLDTEAARTLPDTIPGRCSGPLRELTPAAMVELLEQAACVRRDRKASEFAARARHLGWESTLWEGLLGALGYKHNAWPFRRLAELVPLISLDKNAPRLDALTAEARLLGLAGFLPTEGSRATDRHVRDLWDCWWRERDAFGAELLPAAVWHLAGIRPANRPERRLALAARWLTRPDLPRELEQWLSAIDGQTASMAALKLLELLAPPAADSVPFWSHHWTLRSAAFARPQPLLGAPRVTDLALNVILPWLWARAESGSARPELRAKVERIWLAWPAGEDNSVLKLARQRLFGGGRPRLPGRAVIQQGLLQVTRDFCNQAGALCTDCLFPELVRQRAPELAQETTNPVAPS